MRPASKYLRIGPVRLSDEVERDKAHGLKPLEEASEVHAEWQRVDGLLKAGCELGPGDVRGLVDECCDVIQATCDLLAAFGVHDLTAAMARCEDRNRARGRITG